jgi:uncharacterized protein YeaO (DUF488 family)
MMITIYTSYFGAPGIRACPEAVSIARWSPRWWGKGRRYLPLAPEAELLRLYRDGNIDWPNYQEWYWSQLDLLDPVAVAQELSGKILCCWEKDAKHCHRRIVADWLSLSLGITLLELSKVP